LTAAEGIVLSNLEKTFKSPQGPVRAVRGINVEIAPGETVAFLGPNGAGKSTTIDMLLGLLPPITARSRSSAGRRSSRSSPERSARCCRRAR
jgi:ABC-2 type transport system ATP-binding protein